MEKHPLQHPADMRKLLLPTLALLGVVTWIFAPGGWPRYRASGLRSNCQVNLHQVAAAIRQYTRDWDGHLPSVAVHSAASAKANPKLAYGWADATLPYLKSVTLFQCPSVSHEAAIQPWEAGYTDYYFNSQIQRLPLRAVNNDGNCVLLGEETADLNLRTARFSLHSIPDSWRQNENSPVNIHLLGANYAFVDGHVKWLSREKSPQDCPMLAGSAFMFCP